MRAREFVMEQRAHLPPEERDPMHNTYILPGIRNNDAYHTLRFGVAIARARATVGGVDRDLPPWKSEAAFGQNAVVVGFNDTVDDVIDLALKMTDTPGGKIAASSEHSEEPPSVNKTSPVRGFAGYPR